MEEIDKKREIAFIYYKYKKDYITAFNYYDEIKEYKNALNSLIKLNNISKIFDYINQIYSYLGINEFIKNYTNYINSYLNTYINNEIKNKNFFNEKC